jgi:nicotinamidase-related amidase
VKDKYKIYQEALLGGTVGYGDRLAVLVVDFQRSFVDPNVPGGGDFLSAIKATRRLLNVARSVQIPAIFTVTAYEEHLKDAGLFIEKCPTLEHSIIGSPMVALDPELNRADDEPVIIKNFASGFFGTSLASLLNNMGVDTVVVCGCTTSGCVRASVIDAMQHGFRAIVPRECVADIAEEPHEANLFDIDSKYGDVVSIEEVLDHITNQTCSEPDGLSPPIDRHKRLSCT